MDAPNIINNKKKKESSYKEDIKPNETYSTPTPLINKIEKDENDPLRTERGTIRLPLEQKCELDALLEISLDYSYIYELLAELIYSNVSKLSKEESEHYYASLNRLKEKELIKIKNKNKKK